MGLNHRNHISEAELDIHYQHQPSHPLGMLHSQGQGAQTAHTMTDEVNRGGDVAGSCLRKETTAAELGLILIPLPTFMRTSWPTLNSTSQATAVAVVLIYEPAGFTPPPVSPEVGLAATPVALEAADAAPILPPTLAVAESIPPADPTITVSQMRPSLTTVPTSLTTATAAAMPRPANTPWT